MVRRAYCNSAAESDVYDCVVLRVSCSDCAALLGAVIESAGSKSRVFGVPLRKCVRRDVQLGRGRAPLSPSSESSLLDALSLQSAGAGRVGAVVPRLSVQQLYDEQYCATTLLVPHVVRACCQHLKTHGIN